MTHSSTPSCPDCGAPLPVDSPQSLCPACLLRQALASRTIAPGNESPAPLSPPSPEEIADKFPQFEITECLGRGGMGVVYKARQKSLDRWVAIKILPPERVGEEKFSERFTREAQTLARLNHPNIVTVYDYGETGGLFYIVMEFVDGVNLRDLLREGRLEPKQALAIVPPICEALQFAHDKGIVHRDIKPENLLLDRDGRIKIADFGIASLIGAGGELAGTPPYMAPEQEGTAAGVDHRTDIYALGVVLYEMLTGERPAKELVAPSKKVQIDVRLDEMVLRALEKSPELRYQTAGDFRTMVETLQAPPALDPAQVAPPLPTGTPGPFRRLWWLFLVMPPVCVLLGLAVGAIWGFAAPKRYEVRSVIETRLELTVPLASGEVPETLDDQSWGAAFKSPWILERVSGKLGLAKSWALSKEETNERLASLMSLQRIPGTSLKELRIRHTDAVQAVSIANAWVHAMQSWTIEQGTPERVVVHEEATIPRAPISPNVPLLLSSSAAAGLILSPLVASLLILFLGRGRRGTVPPSTAPRTRSVAVRIAVVAACIAVVAAIFAIKSFTGAARPISPVDEETLIGRAKFDIELPQALSGGWGAELPVFDGQTSRWFPRSDRGQPVALKDGRTLYFKVLTMARANARPKMFVGISENGTDWNSESVEMGPSQGTATIGLDHGAKATVRWTPDPGAAPQPSANWIFITAGVVVLVLLVAGIVMIARLAKSTRSGGGKALGIGCAVVLLGGLLLAAVSVAFLYFTNPVARNAPLARPIETSGTASPVPPPLVEPETPQNLAIEAPKSIALAVQGAVARPGTYTLRPDATLLDALAAAGGWTDHAKLDEVFVNGGGNGVKHDLRKILDGRAPNPVLAAGHNVFVARRKP